MSRAAEEPFVCLEVERVPEKASVGATREGNPTSVVADPQRWLPLSDDSATEPNEPSITTSTESSVEPLEWSVEQTTAVRAAGAVKPGPTPYASEQSDEEEVVEKTEEASHTSSSEDESVLEVACDGSASRMSHRTVYPNASSGVVYENVEQSPRRCKEEEEGPPADAIPTPRSQDKTCLPEEEAPKEEKKLVPPRAVDESEEELSSITFSNSTPAASAVEHEKLYSQLLYSDTPAEQHSFYNVEREGPMYVKASPADPSDAAEGSIAAMDWLHHGRTLPWREEGGDRPASDTPNPSLQSPANECEVIQLSSMDLSMTPEANHMVKHGTFTDNEAAAEQPETISECEECFSNSQGLVEHVPSPTETEAPPAAPKEDGFRSGREPSTHHQGKERILSVTQSSLGSQVANGFGEESKSESRSPVDESSDALVSEEEEPANEEDVEDPLIQEELLRAQRRQKPPEMVRWMMTQDAYYEELRLTREHVVREEEEEVAGGESAAYQTDQEKRQKLIKTLDVLMDHRVDQLLDDHRKAESARKRMERVLEKDLAFLVAALKQRAAESRAPSRLTLYSLHLFDDRLFLETFTRYTELLALLASARAAEEDQKQKIIFEKALTDRMLELVEIAAEKECTWRGAFPFVPVNTMPFSAFPLHHLLSLWAVDADTSAYASLVRPLVEELESLPEVDHNGQRKFETLRLQHAILHQLQRLADEELLFDIRRWVEQFNVYEQYSFLPDLPCGLRICDIGWMNDSIIREHAASRRAMDRRLHSTSQKRGLEQQLVERTDELIHATLRATEAAWHEFPAAQLPLRIGGVLLSELPTKAEAEEMKQLYSKDVETQPRVAPHDGELPPSESFGRSAAQSLLNRLVELATHRKALEMYYDDENEAIRARHPFFPYAEIHLLPLRDLNIERCDTIRQVMHQRVLALASPVGSADRAAIAQIDLELLTFCTLRAQDILEANKRNIERYSNCNSWWSEHGSVSFHVLRALEDEEIVSELRSLTRLQQEGKRVGEVEDIEDKHRRTQKEQDSIMEAKNRIQHRCDELMMSYEAKEYAIAMELRKLREENVFCVHDVNPVVQSDGCFQAMMTMYKDWSRVLSPKNELLKATRTELKERATMLVGDERCELDAICALHDADVQLRLSRRSRPSAAEIFPLVQQRDESFYGCQLWQLRRLRRRLPPFDNFCAEHHTEGYQDSQLFFAPSADTYYLFLQHQQREFELDGRYVASRGVEALLYRREEQLKEDAERLSRALHRKHQAWLQRYHFMRLPPPLALLAKEYLANDKEFRLLDEERCRLLRPPADIAERYPFLASTLDGQRITSLGLDADPLFLRVAAAKENIVDTFKERLSAVKRVEKALKNRFYVCLNDFLRREKELRELYAYLKLPRVSVPLQALYLSEDKEFCSLQAQYEETEKALEAEGVVLPPRPGSHHQKPVEEPARTRVTGHIDTLQADNQLLRRCELLRQAMRERVVCLAREEFTWRSAQLMRMDSLVARLPRLFPEPVQGVRLTDLSLEKDAEFLLMSLGIELKREALQALDEPHSIIRHRQEEKHSARQHLKALEELEKAELELETYVMRLATSARTSLRIAQSAHPHLPDRVDGVLASRLDLLPPSAIPFPSEANAATTGEEGGEKKPSEVPPAAPPPFLTEAEYLYTYRTAAARLKAMELYDIEENNALRARMPFIEWNDVHGVPLIRIFATKQLDREFSRTQIKWIHAVSRSQCIREEVMILETQLQAHVCRLAQAKIDEMAMLETAAKEAGVDILCLGSSLDEVTAAVNLPQLLNRGGTDVPSIEEFSLLGEPGEATTPPPPKLIHCGELLYRADRMFTFAKTKFVEELRTLRRLHPLLTPDVNPAIVNDARLLKMEMEHTRPLEDFTVPLKAALQDMQRNAAEIRLRAASLIQNDGFVLAATPSPLQTHLQEETWSDLIPLEAHPALACEQLEQYCAYFLREAHLLHRQVPLLGMNESSPRRKRRVRLSHHRSCPVAEVIIIPDNEYEEILEDSMNTSVLTSSYQPPEYILERSRSNSRRRHQASSPPPPEDDTKPNSGEDAQSPHPAPPAAEEKEKKASAPAPPVERKPPKPARRVRTKEAMMRLSVEVVCVPEEAYGVVEETGAALYLDDSSRRAQLRRQRSLSRRMDPNTTTGGRLRAAIQYANVEDCELAAGELRPNALFSDQLPEKRQRRNHLRDSGRVELSYLETMLARCRGELARSVSEEELLAEEAAMALVYEHHDLTRWCEVCECATRASGSALSPGRSPRSAGAHRTPPIVSARLSEIDASLTQWIIDFASRQPIASAISERRAKAAALAQQRAAQRRLLRQGEALQQRTMAAASLAVVPPAIHPPPPASFKVPQDVWQTFNPRMVPMRWAHLTAEDLRQDEKLNTLLQRAKSETDVDTLTQKIYAHLCEMSVIKEKKNAQLFEAYSFLPVVVGGLTMLDINFEADEVFRSLKASSPASNPFDPTASTPSRLPHQEQMRERVFKLAKEKSVE